MALKPLLTSIHDVAPVFEGDVDRLADHLTRAGVDRFAMLVVPQHWASAPLRPGSPFATRLRGWSDSGVDLFVHGWTHRDDQPHSGRWAAWKARHMTAGEGEFLGLDRVEARERMRRGRTLIEDIAGRAAAGFIAPAWLYGPGAMAALRDEGFALSEDHCHVWRPSDGAVLARGPVVSWASRSHARTRSSLAFAALARRLLPLQDVIRVAVHPGDTSKPELMASIGRTTTTFVNTHRPARYGELELAS